MGRLFKALAICHPGLPIPPGFEPDDDPHEHRTPPEPLDRRRPARAHGFFTRRGGVSEGPFASLNCNLSGQDDRGARCWRTARRAARALGADPTALLGLTQVHGAEVVAVDRPLAARARAARRRNGHRPPGHRARHHHRRLRPRPVRRSRGRGDRRRPCRLARRGRGRAGGDGRGDGGARRRAAAAIAAAIGPCIGQASYEVGARPARRGAGPRRRPTHGFFAPGRRADRWQFDLAGYCAARLRAAGIARSSGRRRYAGRRGPLLQPPPPHAGRRRPDRAPDLRSSRMPGDAYLLFSILLLRS